MHIEIPNAETMTETEAKAIIAFLHVLHPSLMSSVSPLAILGDVTISGPAEVEAPVITDPAKAFAAPAPQDPQTAFAEPAVAPLSSAAEPLAGAPSPPAAGAVPPPVAPPSGVTLDKDGLPWDARIHAGTKTQNADGRWKAKKSVHAETKKIVEAELRAVLGATPPAPTPQATALAAALANPSAATADVPPPPPPTAAVPPPPAAETAPVNNMQLFANAMQKVTAAQTASKLTVVELASIVEGLGLKQVRDLINRPDLLPAFEAQVEAYVASAP